MLGAFVKRASILLVFLLGCSIPGKAPTSARLPFDEGAPIERKRPKTFHVCHYALTLSFDEAAGEVFGSEAVDFEAIDRPLRALVLDAEGLQVESVEEEAGRPLPFEIHPKTIAIELGSDLAPGQERRISIRYHAFPKRGLHFVHPDDSDPERSVQIWSQGEQTDSHYWFACLDEPDDLSSSEVTGTVRDSETLVSNGRLLGVEPHPESKTRTFRWRIDEPHAAYLTSVVVGTFQELSEERGGVHLSFFIPPSVDRETATRTFGRTGEMLEFFSRRFGVGYPFSRYSQTTVEDFEGAMENVTATTEGEQIFHGRGAEPEENSDSLVAHELAHQWFGDMVTCSSWSEVWLNEAFADFAGGLWTEHVQGEDEYRLQMLEAENDFFDEDRTRYRRRLIETAYFDTNDLFDRATYDKGNWVLSMLQTIVGDRDFFRGIEIYLRDNAWKNVDTAAFQRAMEKASGRGLGWFFEEWVRSAGIPEYRVSSHYDAAQRVLRVIVDQVQGIDRGTPVFSMPIEVDFETPSGFQTHRLELSARHEEFQFPAELAPKLVRFDPGNRVLKLVKFEKSRDELRTQAREDPDVTGRIWAVGELSRRFADSKTSEELGSVASKDLSYGVRAAAAGALEDLCDRTASEALRRCLSDGDSRVRASAAGALSSCRRTGDTVGELASVLERDPSGAVAGAAAESIGKLRASGSLPALTRGLARRKEPAALRGILLGLVELDSAEGREEVLKACRPGRPQAMRLAAIAALGRMQKNASAARKTLEVLLADSNLLVQTESVRAIGELRLGPAVPALRLAAERSPLLREGVENAIRRIESRRKREATS
jgi:aminopeptidase N